jgi:hypothetical protein
MMSIWFLAALVVAFVAIYLLRNRHSADATHALKCADSGNSVVDRGKRGNECCH